MNKKGIFDNSYSNLETSEETKKYISEMQQMEDKNEKKNKIIFASFAVPLILIAAFMVKQLASVSINMVKNNTNIEQSKNIVNNPQSTEDTTSSENKNAANARALNTKIYTYLSDKANRTASLNKAKSLNHGSDKGLSTIFIAEILRNNEYDMPKSIINTKSLVDELGKNGWKKNTDYKQLEKGDIVFTTASKSNSPTHVYIFMGWVEEGKTNYANICDSQISEYSDTLHKRNIDFSTPKKDKFNFFMKKE
ncbi:hypothetical protein [Clostridium sp. ZS2-4]|uniref:hypothetical protein n=1 Tax=Clostridium sp. ZS2-4 TaxID=2987703 RepID=UPI00227A81EE|nr:hypothetical protein [Clostridium sp. ZS2-4]MCY6353810.1 hypothetical protein [Clostridium sp. ZS2-4]